MKVITAAAVGLAGVGLGAAAMTAGVAGATPTASSEGAHRPLSASMTIAPSDLFATFQLSGDVSTRLGVNGVAAMSACTGEAGITHWTGADSGAFHVRHTAPVGVSSRIEVSEQVSETATTARASQAAKSILTGERSCQDEPAGHWRYGATHTVTVSGGKATWMAITNGDGRRGGGVVVAVRDNKVAVSDVTGPASNASLTTLAKQTVSRLH